MPHLNRDHTEDEHADEDDSIPPLGHLRVPGHETGVDVRLLGERAAGLDPDLLAEVEEGVHDRRGDARERQAVRERERRREEERRVRLVPVDVERRLGRDDERDVVRRAGVVERRAGRDRHVLGVPRVRVVEDRGEDPEEEHEAGRDVRRRPPWGCERGADVRDLRPVEGDERHSEAGVVAEELVDNDVLGRNPADPVEEREGLEDVAGEEVPAEGSQEHVGEEAFTGDTTARTHAAVVLRVQGVEESASDEVRGPDH